MSKCILIFNPKPILKAKSAELSIGAKGNSTLAGLCFTLLLSFILILFLYHHSKHLKKIKERSQLYLCGKEFFQAQEKFVNEIETLNLVIKDSTYLEMIKILFPVLAPLPAKEVKQGAQKIQLAILFSYQKKLLSLKSKKCPLDPMSYTTPYRLEAIYFERNLRGETILKKNSWKNVLGGKNLSLLLTMKVTEGHLKKLGGTVWELPY